MRVHPAIPARLGVLLAVLSTAAQGQSYPEKVGPPASMTALGDSISQAANATTLGNHPTLSWSTGSDASVTSQLNQLLAAGYTVTATNRSVSGAQMGGIATQVTNAIGDGPEYVTILMGANDACTSSESTMTDVATFESQFTAAIDSLSASLPDARIFVASVPDVYVLWQLFHTDANAQNAWRFFCQSMLANPTSTATVDEDRRQRVRQRIIDFNTALETVCGQYLHCRYDANGVFNTQFTTAEVSTLDYFHPSLAGQNRLGSETHAGGYDYTDLVAPVTTQTVSYDTAGVATLTLSATDDVAARGIEYRLPGDTRWTRYDAPLTVAVNDSVVFRAVDVNGNLEASRQFANAPPETPDAGADAGIDAGQDDAGIVDAGSDAGAEVADAGDDAGTTGGDPDAGADAGLDGGPRDTGCSCDATTGFPLAVLALAALRRRTKRG